MQDLFLYGPLAVAELWRLFCPAATPRPAHLPHHALIATRPGHWPELVVREGARVEGLRLAGDAEPGLAPLVRAFGLEWRAAGPTGLRTLWPQEAVGGGKLWDRAGFEAQQAAVFAAALHDLTAGIGAGFAPIPPHRWQMMLMRAASRLRAEAETAPPLMRRAAAPQDVEILNRREVYANYFAVEEIDFRHRRFAGDVSAGINRAAFISSDAATVLPYDAKRDRVLVIEQIRSGPLARGARNPWLLEPIAGRVDPFESPEAAARREAMEEAGLRLDALLPIAEGYPSPGAKGEYLYQYLGLCDLPDDLPRLGGLAIEQEDIRAHLVGFEQLMAQISSPDFASTPLQLSLWWLAAHRAKLRAP